MQEFVWPIRVYYEDTDSGGVVYHANYLRFMERARTEWLRRLGFEQDRLRDEERVIFAVRRMELDFLAPARFNDALLVHTRLAAQRRASLLFEQSVRDAGSHRPLERCCKNHASSVTSRFRMRMQPWDAGLPTDHSWLVPWKSISLESGIFASPMGLAGPGGVGFSPAAQGASGGNHHGFHSTLSICVACCGVGYTPRPIAMSRLKSGTPSS